LNVPVNEADRSINTEHFRTIATYFAQKGHPLLVFLIIGSTKGHVFDNVKEIGAILEEISLEHNVPFWVHVDCALYGSILPFINQLNPSE